MKNKLTTLILSCLVINSLLHANETTKSYPKGKIGEAVKLGEELVNNTNTHPLTSQFVGNDLKCKSCHIDGANNVGTFRGVASKFPIYSKRENVIETLQDRVNNCFIRSMNGAKPLTDTKAPIAITTYITWLSSGSVINVDPVTNGSQKNIPLLKKFTDIQKKATHKNYLNGKKLFDQKCASCHGKNGKGNSAFPPLWGKNKSGKWISYNAGAGMSKLHKASLWIQSNMPLGQGGTLSDIESADITLYIDAQPRAEFDLKKIIDSGMIKGYYNSEVHTEIDSVRSNFKIFNLDVDTIRGDKVIK
ncbi:MAG: c-type cytochrome [Helicobacteraceae bacterium]|nr:c-type cytochrome [Helicobacteraceae bacterium]